MRDIMTRRVINLRKESNFLRIGFGFYSADFHLNICRICAVNMLCGSEQKLSFHRIRDIAFQL